MRMKFEIHGGKPLKGEIRVSGAKNAALPLIAASLLTEEEVRLARVPVIEDVQRMVEIVRGLGVSIEARGDHQYTIQAQNVKSTALDAALSPKIRASVLLIGPLLVRAGAVTLPYPGGCAIGSRPIDLFISGFKKFGAEVVEGDDAIVFKAKKLAGASFVFPVVSVTGTEALMMFAARVPGESMLTNAAMEPEVVALAEFLNACGAKITGAGTPILRIMGVKRLTGGAATMIPDRIEAGAFAALAAATKSDLIIRDCDPAHLAIPILTLQRIGVPVEVGKDFLHIRPTVKLEAKDLITHEYPGFPTDLQAPYVVLMTQAHGKALIHETIFDGRLFFTEKLNKMGAKITLADPHRAIVEGPAQLRGTTLESPDIRAGLALVIAGLVARGKTTIQNIYQIDRGYEKIEERLRAIGADIKRVP